MLAQEGVVEDLEIVEVDCVPARRDWLVNLFVSLCYDFLTFETLVGMSEFRQGSFLLIRLINPLMIFHV